MYPEPSQNLTYETDDAVYWFSSAFDPLNNWSAHAVKIWDNYFPTVEHAYHYRKFADTQSEIAEEVRTSPSPWAAMQLARSHEEHIRSDWHKVKVGVMLEILRAKVDQNQDVKNCLLSTGKKHIFENSPWDTFWGCGADGKGENTMGKLLMKVRDEITLVNRDKI